MKTCRKFGHQYEDSKKCCPVCNVESKRKWYEANKVKVADNKRKYQIENKAKITEDNRRWKDSNPEYHRNYQRNWRAENPEYQCNWQAENKEQYNEYQRNWNAENKEQLIEYHRNYRRQRKADDPLFKLTCNIRNLINNAFKRQGFKKNTKTASILSCDFETLQAHLIQTAKNNYGGKYFPNRPYEIDHIIPVSSATTEEELLKLNHYSNLQLLYKQHNREKGDRLDWAL